MYFFVVFCCSIFTSVCVQTVNLSTLWLCCPSNAFLQSMEFYCFFNVLTSYQSDWLCMSGIWMLQYSCHIQVHWPPPLYSHISPLPPSLLIISISPLGLLHAVKKSIGPIINVSHVNLFNQGPPSVTCLYCNKSFRQLCQYPLAHFVLRSWNPEVCGSCCCFSAWLSTFKVTLCWHNVLVARLVKVALK